MTRKHSVLSLSLLFSAVVVSMIVLTSHARAETRSITFTEPVMIGDVVLKPGAYKVSWPDTASDPEVQVTFTLDGKTVATASAKLIIEKTQYHRAFELKTLPDNRKVLIRISFRHKSLSFDQANQAAE